MAEETSATTAAAEDFSQRCGVERASTAAVPIPAVATTDVPAAAVSPTSPAASEATSQRCGVDWEARETSYTRIHYGW
jgi:hypothetical protein